MKLITKSVRCGLVALSFATLLLGVRTVSAQTYPATILADNPIAFYRFNEAPGSTTAADSSSTGQYPGTYYYSSDELFPELAQPGIDTNSILLSSSDPSFVYSGYYPEFNEQGPFSFEIWASPTSIDPVNYRCPIGNFSGWGAAEISGWYVYQTPGTPCTFAFITASGVWITYSGVTPGNWYLLDGTYDGTNCNFYVNGNLVGSENAAGYLANSTAGNYNALGLGERGDDSQFFGGYLDDFAYYTNALTAAQILNHYMVGTNSFSSAAVAPTILQDVTSSTNYAGTSVEFSVLANGTAPLVYQWYEGTSPIGGATNDSLSFTCAPANNGDTYYVVITNTAGSITSSTATLTVSTALQIVAPLTSITRTVGSAAAFEVVAQGALPISYQWYNGATPIAGATNQLLWLSNVQSSNNNASYYVAISNPYTTTNSEPATLTVEGRPVDVLSPPYAELVTADGPVAYWHLDEVSGTNAVDAVGSFDGDYEANGGTFTFGVPIGIPNDNDTGVEMTNGAVIDVPYAIEINPPGAFTVAGWFQPASVAGGGNDYRTAISSMSNPYGIGPSGWLVYQTAANNWSWWPYNGFYNGIQLTDYDQIIANKWYFLAMTYDGTNFTFYVNGVAEASETDSAFVQNGDVPAGGASDYNYNYNTTFGLPTGSGSLIIGQRVDDAFNPFSGAVADVAVYNKALTSQQIRNQFLNEVSLTIAQSGGKVIINWPAGTGMLEESTNVAGPYTGISEAVPPYTNSVTGSNMYYRLLR